MKNGQPNEVCLAYFKKSDVDPRELILLFEDLTNALNTSFDSHKVSNV